MILRTTSNMQYVGRQSYTLFPALPLKYLIYGIFSSPVKSSVVSQSPVCQLGEKRQVFYTYHLTQETEKLCLFHSWKWRRRGLVGL